MYKLRELERNDISIINQWRNNAEFIDLLGAPFRFINVEVDMKWFENYMNNRDTQIRCAILNDETLVGLISLTSIDYLNQTAEVHIMIGDTNCQNKGAGSFALNQMISHAFNNMNLRRLELTVLSTNERARHVYEKLGFALEGIKRNAKYKNGCFVDMCCYALLKQDISK